MDKEQYILISNNNLLISNLNSKYIHKTIVVLDFYQVVTDINTSFRDDNNIIEQFILDCKRSFIMINNKVSNYKSLNKYLWKYIHKKYYYFYISCFTQALLSIPYVILTNSTNKIVGELNQYEKNKINNYFNIVIQEQTVKIYKLLRIFNVVNNIDKTFYYIKITIEFELTQNPDNITIKFKIVKNL